MLKTKKQGTLNSALRLRLPSKAEVFRPIVAEQKKIARAKESEAIATMKLRDVIHLIEGREADDRFQEAKRSLEVELTHMSDAEEKGTAYYYLLRLLLQEHLLYENTRARELYEKMMDNFALAAKNYRKKYKETKDKAERKVLRSQTEAFFQLVDTYLATLEMFYQKRGFDAAHERAYEDRMHYRKDYAYFAGKHLKHMGHFFLDKTSRYGHSFGRWGITVVVFISLFAGFFALLDALSATSMLANYTSSSGSKMVDYLYFSIVTFTTLGYGDIVPITAAEKLLCGFEVLTGFIMLGVLINLIKRRL